jgi:hypothetical protein
MHTSMMKAIELRAMDPTLSVRWRADRALQLVTSRPPQRPGWEDDHFVRIYHRILPAFLRSDPDPKTLKEQFGYEPLLRTCEAHRRRSESS